MTNQLCSMCKQEVPLDQFQPSVRGRVGAYCRSCSTTYRRSLSVQGKREPIRTCTVCQEEFKPLTRRSRQCSAVCRNHAQYLASQERYLAAARAQYARRAAARIESMPERSCLHCGDILCPSKRSDATFCTQRCQRAAHKQTWSRELLSARDGWTCGICSEAVDPNLVYPHPRSPSVDHVVHVSKGGGNELSNLRLAHLVCNQRRNDGP